MSKIRYTAASLAVGKRRGETMREPEEVTAMVRLHELGWGAKRIAHALGVSKNTVKRYLRQGGWVGYRSPSRQAALGEHGAWIAERFKRHRGNAEVVRQELAGELGVAVSLRTVERACAPLRRELLAQALATVRFETAPGQQLQIDFGSRRLEIGGELLGVSVFVATLGYSRRCYVQAFGHERQSAWFEGMEGAFRHFGGVPQEVLLDNARALVAHHDPSTREVQFNERLRAFADYWGFRPCACAPYRARTKGKDERMVGYVKGNALAGRTFASWAQLEGHLAWWMRAVADVRVHAGTGERPIERFAQEAARLRPLNDRPPYQAGRALLRKVHSDACIELDGNRYSVPWRLIGAEVRVEVQHGEVRIRQAEREVAQHGEQSGRRQRSVDPRHLEGIVSRPAGTPAMVAAPALLRPLSEYQDIVGGAW
jgi:transposase